MGAIRQAFARNLAFHRQRHGLTQAQLAEKVGTSPSYIGHLERGDREPSLLTLEELSLALQVQPGELLVLRPPTDDVTFAGEIDELLRGRSSDDVALVARLARAAFAHPRLAEPTPKHPRRR